MVPKFKPPVPRHDETVQGFLRRYVDELTDWVNTELRPAEAALRPTGAERLGPIHPKPVTPVEVERLAEVLEGIAEPRGGHA